MSLPNLRCCELRLIRLLVNGHSLKTAAANADISYQVAKTEMSEAYARTRMNIYELVARVAVADYINRQTAVTP